MKRAPKDQDLLKILKEMESFQAEYPEELLSARRTSFLEQVEQSALAKDEQPASQDQEVLKHLRNLGSVPEQYPPRLLAARRTAFVRRIVWLNLVNLYATVSLAIQKRFRVPTLRSIPTSLLAAGLALAAFVGYLTYENQGALPPASPDRAGTVHSGRILTSDAREVRIICKSGAEPPLCLAGEYQRDIKLTYQGNGTARPAVAKDTMSSSIHRAAFANDGLYGPGASWISNSRNSWIKIDLGKATTINTVTFGRDRLGKLTGHNPGRFVVSLALSDNVYANGNHSNDTKEYQPVYDSKKTGFSGKISGPETVTARFTPQVARYIKITFENKGTAIDEVEAFMARPSVAGTSSRDKKSDDSSPSPAATTSSPALTATSLPVDTATSLPTATLVPSDTLTPVPTATYVPTNTPVLTSTPVPSITAIPTDTPITDPSNTPAPPPTNTPVPPDTATPGSTEPPTPGDVSPRTDYFDYLTSMP